MAISRAQLLKELVPGLNALFGLEYNRYPQEWAEIFDTESSERAFEEEQKLSGFGLARTKNEGSSVSFDNGQEVWTARYTHETVALGFSITEEAMEDNLYDSLSTRYTKALARSMAYTKDVKGATILNNGFTTYNAGDGVTLFNTAHPTVSGLTNSNAAAIPVDLNETSIEAMTIQIAAWVDERGLLIAAKPQKLIIPPNLMFVAERLVKSRYRTTTSDNDISAMVSMNTIPEGYAVNHFLTGPYTWFAKTDVPDGLKHFERSPMKTSDEEDFVTTNYLYKARERYSFGVSDPLGIWGTNPAT
jgi:hypothetical protein